MTRWFRMALGLTALAMISGEVRGQELRPVDGRQVIVSRPSAEVVVPGQTVVSRPYHVSSVTTVPPTTIEYGRPAGLIETAARRINPFSPTSRAWDVAFAPSVYRQPDLGPRSRAFRPRFGVFGQQAVSPYPVQAPTAGYSLPHSSTHGEMIPGVNCPTCPR